MASSKEQSIMRHGQSNTIGAFLTIAIGASLFAVWLYLCYPAAAHTLANESRQSWSFLMLAGFIIVAVFAVSIASTVLHNLMLLLQNLLQFSLVIALVVGGVFLWRNNSANKNKQAQPSAVQVIERPAAPQPINFPEPKTRSNIGRWWEH